MIPLSFTASPVEATGDQAATIQELQRFGANPRVNVTVDAGPLPVATTELCETDWIHGWATVCLPRRKNEEEPGVVCPSCAAKWLWWHPGEQVALDILRVPTAPSLATAA